VRSFLVVAAAALLVSCGGKSQPEARGHAPDAAPEAPAAAGRPHTPDTRRVLVAFGDSLTAGFGAPPGSSYPDFLQHLIDARHLNWRVVNKGVSGDTTTDGLARLAEVIHDKPEIVILELGANDGLRGLPIATTRSNLQQIIEALRKGGAKVVLAGMTLPPNYGPDYIHPFEQIFRGLARQDRLTLIPFLLQGVAGHPSLMQPDGLHPTAEGNRLVAADVMRVIAPLL
jgi:acyl-CoA thioesterase I